MFGILLVTHLLAATVWTGGHIVLSVVILPKVLKQQSPSALLEFESVFEKIGMPALVLQIITGAMLAYRRYLMLVCGLICQTQLHTVSLPNLRY